MAWEEIARRVKTRRMDLDLTQQAASSKAGIGSATWWSVEHATDDSTFHESSLRRICAALGWPRNRIAVWRGDEATEEPEDANEAPPAAVDLAAEVLQLRAEVNELRVAMREAGPQPQQPPATGRSRRASRPQPNGPA